MSIVRELLDRVDAAKAELDALRPLDREREDRVMQKFRFWWTYHSNAIEGNSLTQGETEMFLMEGLTAKGKPLKDHLDLRGHSEAINYLLDFVRAKQVLTEATIRELHKILLVEPYEVPTLTPDGLPTKKTVALGQYKTQANHVRTPTGETHYYATPEETPAKMHDLISWYRDQLSEGTLHPVEVAARFHHRFTAIHPFDDGNGRMSRLLMNLMLMQSGYPPSVIRNSERDEYIAGLRRADAGDYQDFISFVAEHVVSSLELFLRAARGEEIGEPTDIEKEITILKIELQHVEEPQPLSSITTDKLFEESLKPLYAEIARTLTPLCELFAENFVVTGSHQTTIESGQFPPIPKTQKKINLQFNLKGFKKARFDTFGLSIDVGLHLEPLFYSLGCRAVSPPVKIQHFYQESLTKDEIVEVAQLVARFFVDAIRKKTSGHS